ncbi:glycosyltransferase family 9 protein [Desulfoferrobacter suflitae]|uniref:glycosyltransferase family 9 protein n=1 Tax=Desulfoferrobacter suflitae TaxID=2865782 RepID=UPI0021643754|nr:glycosyltransferase family 9 protein [Desulfoferrobacter suflitae]MCK8600183.1 glycosyltransferase family 9 protein [Desulfoferrobacter suflitae]
MHGPLDTPARNVLILHQGALGDFLLAVPVFEGLHQRYPGTLFDFCSRPEYAALLADKPYFGSALSVDGCLPSSLYHPDLWQNTQLVPCFESAHVVLLFGQDGSRIIADRLAHLAGCPVHWIRSFPPAETIRPVTRFLLEQLRCLGLNVPYVEPRLRPLSMELEAVRAWIAGQGWSQKPAPILIHPGSGGRGKIWPLNRWWSLLGWLHSHYNHPIVMVLGAADSHLKPFALEAAHRLGVALLEGVALERLAALASVSQMYVGNDSGVSHLAAAIGIPTTVIFGPTVPEIWAPQGAQVHVVRSRWCAPENLTWTSSGEPDPVEEPVRVILEKLLLQLQIQNRPVAQSASQAPCCSDN